MYLYALFSDILKRLDLCCHKYSWLHCGRGAPIRPLLGPYFFKGPEIGEFGGLGGPGGSGDPPEAWGASPPTFLKGCPGPQGRPDPQNDRSPIFKKL